MSRIALTALVLPLLLGVSTLAGASATSRLVYSRTPGAARCPDERRFRVAVRERLGYDPFFPWAEQTVTVDIFEEKSSLRAKLSLVDRDGIVRGTRELKGTARDCEELLASLALATSITLDPMAAQMGGAPRTERDAPADGAALSAQATPSSTASGPPVVTGTAPRAPTRGERVPADARDEGVASDARHHASPRTTWSLLAGPVIAVGETPSTSLGGRVGVQVRRGYWALGAELRADLPTSERSEAGGTAHVGVLGGAIAPCFSEGPWSACGVVYLGSMNTRGGGVDVPLATSLFFAAAGARAEVLIPLSKPVDLRFHVDGMKSLIVSHFFLHGREVWETPPFWAGMGISATVLFP